MAEFIPLPKEQYKSKLPFPTYPTGYRAIDWALRRLPELEQGTDILNSLIETVKKNDTKIIVLSPHEDDIPLSVGGLMKELPSKNIHTVTFFTQALASAHTSDKDRYLSPGFTDITSLYEKRQEEDLLANTTLGIPRENQYHLGFIDAPWRTKVGTNKPVYPQRMSQLGHISKEDREVLMPQLQSRLKDQVQSIVGNSKNYLILAPAALGMTSLQIKPVDHEIIREIASAAFPANEYRDHVVYYGEYPYMNEATPDKKLSMKSSLPALHAVPDQTNKRAAITCHQTQISRLFDAQNSLSVGAMPKEFPPELYFVTKKNLETVKRQKSAV